MRGRWWILVVLALGTAAVLGYRVIGSRRESEHARVLNCSPAIAAFSVVNASGTETDLKGGPPLSVVGHHLDLHVVVAPAVGTVRINTSSGPLSPPENIVSVEATPDSQGQVDIALDVPGRPDRVFADAVPRAGAEQVCAAGNDSRTTERMVRLDVKP